MNVRLVDILAALRQHDTVVAAARALGCSDGFIHQRLKRAGLSASRFIKPDPDDIPDHCPKCGQELVWKLTTPDDEAGL